MAVGVHGCCFLCLEGSGSIRTCNSPPP
ncbi:hypothetical protein LEMLEM_LOCUS2563 [Lemmus lemmus]